MATKKLAEIAKTIRSKNAGVDKITFDVIFSTEEEYTLVRRSGVLTRATICELFGLRQDRITDFDEFDPAFAIKFTILRDRPSGSPGDPDIFGAQQYAPLMDTEIPV